MHSTVPQEIIKVLKKFGLKFKIEELTLLKFEAIDLHASLWLVNIEDKSTYVVAASEYEESYVPLRLDVAAWLNNVAPGSLQYLQLDPAKEVYSFDTGYTSFMVWLLPENYEHY